MQRFASSRYEQIDDNASNVNISAPDSSRRIGLEPVDQRSSSVSRFSTEDPRQFVYQNQTRTIFWEQFSRFLITAILVTSILVVIKVYENKGPVSLDDKRVFIAITTALILVLGLNLLVGLLTPSVLT